MRSCCSWRIGLVGFIVMIVCCESPSPARAQFGVRQTDKATSLGKVDPKVFEADKRCLWVSPDGRHVAWTVDGTMSIDGRTRKYELGIRPETFSFSPDSQHTVYAGRVAHHGVGEVIVYDEQPGEKIYNHISAAPRFSPDSKHLGFVGRLEASSFDCVPVVDGREGDRAESFNWEVIFTPDSQRLVYAIEVDDAYSMRELPVDPAQPVVERSHGPAVLTGNFFFGPKGQLGYITSKEGKHSVFYNGQEDPNRFEEIERGSLVFSDDGEHLAYVAEPSSFRNVVVYDGKKSKTYDDFVDDSLNISPDGKHWGYAIEDFREHYVVLDGKEGKRYAGVSGPVYSPDSKRVGYLAAENGQVFSVVDGREGKRYDDRGMPVFSPDGQSAAYWAAEGNKRFMVVGGKPQKAYDDIGIPLYNKDGKRLIYLAKTGDKWLLVDNGKEGKLYDDILGGVFFSEDGQRLAIIAKEGDHQRVVVNGVEGAPFDLIVNFDGGRVHFDPNNGIHYVALKGDEAFLVETTAQ